MRGVVVAIVVDVLVVILLMYSAHPKKKLPKGQVKLKTEVFFSINLFSCGHATL